MRQSICDRFGITLKKALMIGIQTGTGEMFHQDAQALILLAFSDAESAVAFQSAYLKMKENNS